MHTVIERAERALVEAAHSADARGPMAATLALAARRIGEPIDMDALLSVWTTRQPGNRLGDARYRWELTHERVPAHPYCPPPEQWRPWRARDTPVLARDRARFELRLTVPISVADGLALLASQGEREMLREAERVARTDLATYVRATHTWTDCFALRCLVERPAVLDRMRPFAFAIATAYAAETEPGERVKGMRFPFHDAPLSSATSMLAGALQALGQETMLAAGLIRALASAQRDDGGFGDGGFADEPSDLFTTFLAAELLGRVEPSFDAAAAASFVAARQTEDGFFRALGPETPWLTDRIATWLRVADRPFAERFRWPAIPDANRDRKTGLPPYAYFVDLAELFASLPGLAEHPCSLAFMDLVGFRAFNNRYGQELGDEVLAELADAIAALSLSVAVRDGGDEFLVVGAPGASIEASLDAFEAAWPARFAERFGTDAPPVVARVLIGELARGASLRSAREELGRAVGTLKQSGALRMRLKL